MNVPEKNEAGVFLPDFSVFEDDSPSDKGHVEKKEEKQEIKSWVVNEDEISKTFSKKFDMNKEDTDFESLTDQGFNKELEEVPLWLSRKRRDRSRKTSTRWSSRRKEASSMPSSKRPRLQLTSISTKISTSPKSLLLSKPAQDFLSPALVLQRLSSPTRRPEPLCPWRGQPSS